MTDNEIAKALDVCGHTKGCTNCPLGEFNEDNCMLILTEETVDLINRLQAENECLKALNGRLVVLGDRFRAELKTAKAEAYKEFAERLKKEATSDRDVQYVFELKIDNALKEMVGEV